MMMKVANGPDVAGPLDFTHRKRPVPRWIWMAAGASLLIHGVAVMWLYQQKFEMPTPPAIDEGPVTVIELFRPPPPPEPRAAPQPVRQAAPVHRPTLVETPQVIVPVAPVDNPSDNWTLDIPRVELPTLPHTGEIGGTGVAETASPAVIVNPRLIARPTPEQLRRAYPTRAMANGAEGTAMMQCSVTARGGLADCAITSETPAGQGFGRAAQQLSRHFRVSPRTVDGQTVEGARVNIGLTFQLD